MAWQRDRPDTVELPIDALALLVLRDYDQVNGWNWQNWMRESEQFGTARDPEINLALSEAWSWLMTHGLVVRDSSQSSTDAYRISRLGRETFGTESRGSLLVSASGSLSTPASRSYPTAVPPR